MDLIDRQETLCEIQKRFGRPWVTSLANDAYVAYKVVEMMPSAHSEIIRCKDCKNWDKTWTNDWSPDYHYCPIIDGVRKGDFYCADAERRTDE